MLTSVPEEIIDKVIHWLNYFHQSCYGWVP
jgi:hypothetical protein